LTPLDDENMTKQALTPSDFETWLKTQNLDAKKLAKMLNLPTWTVRRWETGRRNPPPWLGPTLKFIEKSRPLQPSCRYCEKPLPVNCRIDTKFCSGKCKTRAYLERKAEAAM